MVGEYHTLALVLERNCSILSKITESGFSLQSNRILQSKKQPL